MKADLIEQWAVLVNTGGLALFSWVVYQQLRLLRIEFVASVQALTEAAQANGRMLAVLQDRVERER